MARPLRSLGWLVVLVASAAACGSSKESDYHPNNPGFGGGGSNAGGGSAGASGGSAGASAGGTAGSGATGGSVTGGTGGAGNTGGGGCAGYHVTGTLDGLDVDTSVASGAMVDSGLLGSKWVYRVLLEGGGMLSIEGAAGAPSTGDPVTGTAYFAAPPSSGLAGVHLLSASASMKYMDGKQPIVLASLSRAGKCPGTPVQGSLSVCVQSSFASGTPCGGVDDVRIKGSLDGASIDLGYSDTGFFSLGSPQQVAYIGIFPSGVAYAHDFGGKQSGRLAIPTSPAGPHAGEVLCAGSASAVETSDTVELTLSSLSKAGTQPGQSVSGTLELSDCP